MRSAEKKIEVGVRIPGEASKYRIACGSGLLDSVGEVVRSALGEDVRRVAVISNRKVFGLYGERVELALKQAGVSVSSFMIGDGERFKTLKTAEKILAFLNSEGIKRSDAVVALGGGVVGDAAGFAASLHLRGVALIQLPTTLLAMIDSSVGGKTGVNSSFGKNLIGTFHQPTAVVADVNVLATLDPRELSAGLFEAVKHGAIAGEKLLPTTEKMIDARGRDLKFIEAATRETFAKGIAEHVKFKALIVKGDAREAVGDVGNRSRKILNFGHTLAHALELATGYRYLKHGEAVGHGVLFAAELSKRLELLPPDSINFLNDVVHRVGGLPAVNTIDFEAVLSALSNDKKSRGGSIEWVLLEGIGRPEIVSDKTFPVGLLRSSLKAYLESTR
ncbi:MAG: 3-dehydroquinate synthase [Acidobacteria bacterium]|nr:3-dehydroquinate synthase [Acidobacteriota bacterium]